VKTKIILLATCFITGCSGAYIRVSSDIGLAAPVAKAALPLVQIPCRNGSRGASTEVISSAKTLRRGVLREEIKVEVKCY
jgi:hypothetical protein